MAHMTRASSKRPAWPLREPARWSACRRLRTFSGAATKVSEYRDEFDQEPGTWSPYTYDSLNFLAEGAEKAGSTAAKKLTAALNGIDDWKGWTPQNGNRQPATVVIVDTDAEGQLHVDEDWAKAVGAPY